ncbi:hypothetical protein Ava_1310 [Trichormus variabilis ATCC 29413]|uniref:Uncharacterized protein n=2 Tax=Anabaena variabilis TaxID=264691 RepID=Q3MDK2_TRIV2|nr:hypothetical protein [Trichormus variabilis]ABA20934.1 hypothetical protein Ava_1310 [Trichormus variabilis ATCC 29413]
MNINRGYISGLDFEIKIELGKVEFTRLGSSMMTLQEIINSIENLPTEEQEYLFEFLRQQRIDNRRVEILANTQEVIQALKDGTAKRGSVDDLIADLLGDDDGSCLE